MAGALAIGPLALADDHGDTLDTATRVALPSETAGVIDPGDDVDLFRFEVPATRIVTAETAGGLDSFGALYDANGNLLGINDDAENLNFSITLTLAAGTYYVGVTSYGDGTGSYVLHLRARAAAEDDHGGDRATATRVALPSQTAGVIDPGNDEDWFRFEVSTGGDVTAETTGNLDTIGDLYDADGNLLATNDDAVIGQNLNFRIEQRLDAGTYYVRVSSFVSAVGSYELHLRAGSQEDDHGDSRATATRVALPSQTDGTIGSGSDRDWFRFEVASAGTVTAVTISGLDTVGHLYDASGNQLATNDDAATNFGDFRIRQTLRAGTYYVRVGAASAGSYVLHLRQSGADDDHGNSAATATAVALPSNVSAHIDPAGDVDWFRLDATSAGTLTIRASVTSGDLILALALADRSYAGGTFDAELEWPLEAGTHHLAVWHNDGIYGGGTGDYALALRFEAADVGADAAPGHLRNLGDFNGDGKDDVLLRHADGRWHYSPMDGAAVLPGSGDAGLTRDLTWQPAGLGDFDGDGKDDVLLRKTDGRWYFYPMDGRTVRAGRGTVPLTRDLAWHVAGIGDFDGDGKDDVLLRKTDGRWYFYPMDGRTVRGGRGTVPLTRDLAWEVAGIGDFDGDGKDDVLLRKTDGRWFLYPMDGRTVRGGRGTVRMTWDLAWQVAGVGDFDADGRHDMLLRHEDGRWQYYPLQGRRVLAGAGLVNLTSDTSTTVAGIGDLNGDGCADVLARLANGRWQYYALDGRQVLSASGEAALSADRAWGALPSGGTPTGNAPALGATLTDHSAVLGQDATINLAKAFVDDQPLTYEAQSSNAAVVRASVDGDVLTLTPVAEGTATVTVTARDPDGNAATQTFAVTVAESTGGGGGGGDTFRDCAECPLMVRIPAGTFTQGSPESEASRGHDEGPQREVSVPAFAAGAYEVTFAEWEACVDAGGCDGHRPRDSGWGRGDRPVIIVSWDDAQLYVDWLSRSSGQHYRLLTESEWEYAARAGTTTPFHTGETITTEQANFDGRYGYPAAERDDSGLFREQTVPVGSFAPNGFGLYDMHGNVWEWVQDCWSIYEEVPSDGSAVEGDNCWRVLRGGSFYGKPSNLRAANRSRGTTGNRLDSLGFRVARTL